MNDYDMSGKIVITHFVLLTSMQLVIDLSTTNNVMGLSFKSLHVSYWLLMEHAACTTSYFAYT